MTDPLPPEVVANAEKAACSRCKIKIVGSKGMEGTVFFSYFVPSTSHKQRGFLCGSCGLLLREFLYPDLVDNQEYQEAVASLRAAW